MFSESHYQSLHTVQSSYSPIPISSERYYPNMHVITTTDKWKNKNFL